MNPVSDSSKPSFRTLYKYGKRLAGKQEVPRSVSDKEKSVFLSLLDRSQTFAMRTVPWH